MKIDFLYLNEEEMIKAGVLDAKGCIETMRDTLSLFGKKDFLLGGPKADEHGLQMNFPQKSDIEGFPLDDGPDRRFMAMPAYLGGRFHIAGQKYYGSNSHNSALGLPRSILMVTLSDVDTGAPKAIMSANLLSAMRTGAMPAMAATYLANKDSKVLSILGPGVINKCALMCYMSVLPEIEKVCGLEKTPCFCPIVADYPCGMEVTVPIFSEDVNGSIEDIKNCYREYYDGKIIKYVEDDENGFLSASAMAGKDGLNVSVYGNSDRILLVSRFDNLGKGASGAAIQNMNIVLNKEETEGLIL